MIVSRGSSDADTPPWAALTKSVSASEAVTNSRAEGNAAPTVSVTAAAWFWVSALISRQSGSSLTSLRPSET